MIVTHADGLRTSVEVRRYPLSEYRISVACLPKDMTLLNWCGQHGVEEALVGGFYLREPQTVTDPLLHGLPLGEVVSGGVRAKSVPFDAPWGERRACLRSQNGQVNIDRRDRLPGGSGDELLQAGPLLVDGGRPAPHEEEGFSAGSGQFDSDITEGRHPRAALGMSRDSLIAVATEGRTETEAGFTIEELAGTMVDLGARSAMNLDGGGSTSLVSGGKLQNVSREGDGTEIPGGRPIATALVFTRR